MKFIKIYKKVIATLVMTLIISSNFYFSVRAEINNNIPFDVVSTFYGDSSTSMGFAWYTNVGVDKSMVQVVEDGQEFTSENIIGFEGNSKLVNTSIDSSTKKDYVSHKVIATGLKSNRKYKYRVGDGEVWSKVGAFSTNVNNNDEFTFLYTADTQGKNENDFILSGKTFDEAYGRFPDAKFMVIPGDLVDTGNYESQWSWLFDKTKGTLSNMPVVPAVGNHEGSNPNFSYHFNLPAANIGEEPDGSVYSFDYGSAHFMVLNTQMYKTDELNKQIDWVRKEVINNDKKWNIVILHKGIYSTASHINDSDIVNYLRPELTKAFDELGIDIVLQGHDHVYARTKQLKGGKPTGDIVENNTVNNPDGTVYITNNTAGFKFYNPVPTAPLELYEISQQPNKQIYTGIRVSENELTLNSYLVGSNEIYDAYTIKKDDLKVNFKVEDDWITGAQWSMEIENTSGRDIEGWNIEFDFNKGITQCWNGQLTSGSDSTYKISNIESNKTLKKGEKIILKGICGGNSKEDKIKNVKTTIK